MNTSSSLFPPIDMHKKWHSPAEIIFLMKNPIGKHIFSKYLRCKEQKTIEKRLLIASHIKVCLQVLQNVWKEKKKFYKTHCGSRGSCIRSDKSTQVMSLEMVWAEDCIKFEMKKIWECVVRKKWVHQTSTVCSSTQFQATDWRLH